MPQQSYGERLQALRRERDAGNISPETYEQLSKELAAGEYGPQADLSQFETLLSKLEGSKMRQQRQKSVEGRRDIYSQGLASMMSNF